MHELVTAVWIVSAKYLFVAPIVILGMYVLRQKWSAKKPMILFALPALILTYAVGVAGNHLYFDPRPFVVGHFTPLVAHAPDNGFPSDHTLLVSAIAAIGFCWNRKLGAVLAALALIVGVARVAVGLHHPIDVVASMAIAAVLTSAVFLVFRRVARDEAA